MSRGVWGLFASTCSILTSLVFSTGYIDILPHRQQCCRGLLDLSVMERWDAFDTKRLDSVLCKSISTKRVTQHS